MNRSRRLNGKIRVHRVEFVNRCVLSDCCGAPILPGGICFECRERCQEEAADSQPFPYEVAPASRVEEPVGVAKEPAGGDSNEENSANPFDEMVLKIICA